MSGYAMPKIGDVIAAKYRLEKVAGEGGMGIVYAAEHLVLKQRVAVKVLLPEAASSEAVVERFAREARAAAKINSEHVARVLDAGSLTSGALFLVMEFLEGCDLEELLALQDSLPVAEVVDYLIQSLEGLAHAHAVGVVHRDLKPANLFLACRPDGTSGIKLLDFGISKTTRSRPEDKRLTGHHVLGSPVYMSPEQLRNSPDIDPRADLWSIGIVGYELLAGVPPFDGEGVGEIFAAILEKSPAPLSDRNPRVPEELSNILARCLRRDPAERWQNAGELARALAPFGSDPATAVVERAEQVLARARMMAVPSTPLEARRVVAAIDAAKARVLTSGVESDIPSSRRGRRADERTVTAMLPPRIGALVRRSPALTGAAALATGLAIVALATLGVRATRASSVDQRLARVETRAVAMPPPPAPAPSPSESTRPIGEPPLVMDLPPTDKAPSGSLPPARAAGSKPNARPQRPKFLTTRE